MPAEFKKKTENDPNSSTRLGPSVGRATPSTPAPVVSQESKYGKENFELLQKLISLLDNGQKELLRKRYIDMLGIRHLSDTEQDKMLWTNRAYQKATADLDLQVDKQKRMLREIFDRSSSPFAHGPEAAPAPVHVIEAKPDPREEEALKLRKERLSRLRKAQAMKLRRFIDEYEKKKRLYDSKFEKIESDAYDKGMTRIEEDRKRYEALSAELEDRMKREQEAISAAQQALIDIETTREEAREELENTRKLERDIKQRVKDMLGLLKSALPGLEALAERLAADTDPDPRLTTKRSKSTSETGRGKTVSDEGRDPRTSTSKGLRPPTPTK